MSKLPIMVFVAVILVASFVALSIPTVDALEKRDMSSPYTHNPITARLGNSAVCGDHMCAPGEWDKLIDALSAAQRNQEAGWTAAHPVIATNETTPMPPTTSAGTSPAVCNSIENMLTSAGVSDSIVSKVMSDLGCSYQ